MAAPGAGSHGLCPSAVLLSIPEALVGNELSSHDGFYLETPLLQNDAPAFRWHARNLGNETSQPVFLFRAHNGAWVLGPEAGGRQGKIQSNTFDAACPADVASWAYFNGVGDRWRCTLWDDNCTAGSGITVSAWCAHRVGRDETVVPTRGHSVGLNRTVRSGWVFEHGDCAAPPLPVGVIVAIVLGGVALLLAACTAAYCRYCRDSDRGASYPPPAPVRRVTAPANRPPPVRVSSTGHGHGQQARKPQGTSGVSRSGLPREWSPTRHPDRSTRTHTVPNKHAPNKHAPRGPGRGPSRGPQFV